MKQYLITLITAYILMVVISHFAYDIPFTVAKLYMAAGLMWVGSVTPNFIIFRTSLFKPQNKT